MSWNVKHDYGYETWNLVSAIKMGDWTRKMLILKVEMELLVYYVS